MLWSVKPHFITVKNCILQLHYKSIMLIQSICSNVRYEKYKYLEEKASQVCAILFFILERFYCVVITSRIYSLFTNYELMCLYTSCCTTVTVTGCHGNKQASVEQHPVTRRKSRLDVQASAVKLEPDC